MYITLISSSLTMSMNFANLKSAMYNIEVSLLLSLHKQCCNIFEESEQLSITFK